MSANLTIHKIEFSVFGRGYDDERGNSGDGADKWDKRIGYGAGHACFDETGTYFWLTQNQGQYPFNYLGKGKVADLESIEITTIPTDTLTRLYHPSNVANNYGIAFQNFGASCDIYVFDLTDDTIYHHFTASVSSMQEVADCIMVGDVFYFTDRGVANGRIYKLDTDNETFVEVTNKYFSNGGSCGFVDNDTLYGYNNPAWFSDYAQRYGYGLSGSNQWSIQAPSAGGSGFPRCYEKGLCANGYIWLASNVDGAWRWGMYDGNNGGDFVTPSPIRYIGEFDSDPRYTDFYVYYSDERTMCAYVNNLGMWVTDFHDVWKITSEYWKPLAVNEEYIIAIDRYVNNTYIFKYR